MEDCWEKGHEAAECKSLSVKSDCEAKMTGLGERKASRDQRNCLKGSKCELGRECQIEGLYPHLDL